MSRAFEKLSVANPRTAPNLSVVIFFWRRAVDEDAMVAQATDLARFYPAISQNIPADPGWAVSERLSVVSQGSHVATEKSGPLNALSSVRRHEVRALRSGVRLMLFWPS